MASQCIHSALHAIRRIDRMTARNGRQSNVIPIYTEFGQVTVWGPIAHEKRQTAFHRGNETATEQEEQATNTGETPYTGQANRQTNEPSAAENGEETQEPNAQNAQPQYSQHPVIQDVTQDFTSVSLDVNAARKHLVAANMALQQGKSGAADRNLKAVQDSVDLAFVAVDRPLVQARENLILARDMACQGRYMDMQAPLREAASALQTYESEGTSYAADAGHLSQQITTVAAQLSPSTENSLSVQQIDNWWHETRIWSSSTSVSQSPSQ